MIWYFPAMISVSKKFSAAASIRTTASPGPGDGVGDIGEFEVVGRAVTGAEQGFHGVKRLWMDAGPGRSSTGSAGLAAS